MTRIAYKPLLLSLLITGIGIITIYSSTLNSSYLSDNPLYLRQFSWSLLGLICLLGISRISYRRLWDGAYLFYIIGVVLLLIVAFAGLIRLGAQRWLKIFWFSFQPSELMKLVMVIFLARYFSKQGSSLRKDARDWGFTRAVLIPFGFIALPFFLILKQPDLGTAIFIFLIFIVMLFIAQVNLKFILFILTGLILALPLTWQFLKDYQKTRLLVFLNPNADPLGAGYTIIQSKIAISSGGLFGKGWLAGSQSQLRFLPESHTDFIFATFAEEWGFAGSLVLLLLYYFLIRYALKIAQKAPDSFGRFLAGGIAMILSIQIMINIAMTIGLAPVVGIPLPLLSYGGSCTLMTFLSLGILINIEKRTVF
ncbi:rod shape-determining protein RodA [Candidatus Omnitrophota bacterium]